MDIGPPALKKTKTKLFWFVQRALRPSFKKVVGKKSFLSLRTFFFAAFPNFFLIPPRLLTALGRFRGGGANQRVDQTKTRRLRGSIMSAAVAELTVEV